VPSARLSVVLALALAALTATVTLVLGLRAIATLSYEYDVADRPAQVYSTLESLLAAALDLETGERGYLLTGDDAFLEPYEAARTAIPPLVERLEVLVSWNSTQVDRMPILRRRLDALRAYHAETIGARRAGTPASTLMAATATDGKARMDALREMIRDMQTEATRVRGLRERSVARAQRSARRSLWAAGLGMLLAVGLAAGVALRAIRTRDVVAADLADSNAAMTQALAEREAALHRVRTVQTQLVQQEKLAGLGRLSAGVAHELKNPLNFVVNFAALAEEAADDALDAANAGDMPEALVLLPDVRDNARKVREHADRADRIVRSMLTHAHGVTGSRQSVELRTVLTEATTLALGLDTSGVEVVTEAPPTPVVIEGVPLALGRLFQNLIENAAYAVRERIGLTRSPAAYAPRITLRTRVENDLGLETVVVEVEDNGAGIPEADLARIFEPFFTTKGPGQGTGLGLSMAHDIAVGHGGSITARPAAGGGARFVVRLPLHAPATQDDGEAPEADDAA